METHRAVSFTFRMLDIDRDGFLEPKEIGPASVHHFDRNGDSRLSENELTLALARKFPRGPAERILVQEALHDRAVECGERSLRNKVAGAELGVICGGLAAITVLFLGPVGWALVVIGAAAGAWLGRGFAQESERRASRRLRSITQGNLQRTWRDYADGQDPPFLPVPVPPGGGPERSPRSSDRSTTAPPATHRLLDTQVTDSGEGADVEGG